MSNVRWSEDTGWEMRCTECPRGHVTRWWPLTTEFWNPRNMARCRACTAEQKRTYEQRKQAERSAYMKAYRVAAKGAARITNRLYYEAHKDEALDRNRGWKAANRERVNALARARYARKKAA